MDEERNPSSTCIPCPGDLSRRLDSLAQEIGRLRPDWQRPERFFERRDELRREARSIATQINEHQ